MVFALRKSANLKKNSRSSRPSCLREDSPPDSPAKPRPAKPSTSSSRGQITSGSNILF